MELAPKAVSIFQRTHGCAGCVHFKGVVCDAFPDGIPSEILMGVQTHDKPIAGDRGIQYEPNMDLVREQYPDLLTIGRQT